MWTSRASTNSCCALTDLDQRAQKPRPGGLGRSQTQPADRPGQRINTPMKPKIKFLRLLPALIGAGCLAVPTLRAAEAIHFAGHDAELKVSEISERTLRIQLSPLDASGKPVSAPPSTVLVPFPSTEKFHARELAGEKQLRVGKLRVTLKSQPLTVEVRRGDGKLVQELVFDDGPHKRVCHFSHGRPGLRPWRRRAAVRPARPVVSHGERADRAVPRDAWRDDSGPVFNRGRRLGFVRQRALGPV